MKRNNVIPIENGRCQIPHLEEIHQKENKLYVQCYTLRRTEKNKELYLTSEKNEMAEIKRRTM